MTLDVGVNLLWLAPGRVGGSEEYLVRQLGGLFDLEPAADVAPTLYCQPSFIAAHPGLVDRFDTRSLPLDRDWRGLRLAAEHSWLAIRSRRHDVVHHGGGTVPFVGGRPVVLTVHDLQYRRFPEYFGAGRRRYLDLMMPRSVRAAAVVAVPSEFVRSTVIESFDVDQARVVVVPHGIPTMARPAEADIAAVRVRHGLDDRPYVVYPAMTHPHKGHRLLVETMRHLDDVRLVLIGGEGAAEPAVRAAIDSVPAGSVVRAGRVPAPDRDALIAGAAALVFPSEYEGFGAPVIEAMALDTPVVCSSAPALREIVGAAAIVVDDADPTAWAHAIGRACDQRDVLVAAGRERRRAFTPATSAAAIASAYRLAAAS